MYKPLIAPLQHWLLSQGRCVGCGKPLRQGKPQKNDGIILVTCTCRRIFVYHPETESYKRALFSEVEQA